MFSRANYFVLILTMFIQVNNAYGAEPNKSMYSCGQQPIKTAAEAEQHALCLFTNISEVCQSTSKFSQEVIQMASTWKVISKSPNSTCHTWVVIFRAENGQVLKLSREQ